MLKPKFNIIIPAHNSEAYIKNALRSMAVQTFTNFDTIVICDSCDDHTEEIARDYGCIVDTVNYGCDGPTRNRGLDMATADWILFMDDDDWWVRRDVLEILANVIDAGTAEFDILAFAFEWPNYSPAPPRGNNGFYWPAVWTKCWNREFIGDTRFLNIPMESDYGFWKAIVEKRPRVSDMNVVMYHYNYMRKGSQTERKARE